MINSNFQIFAEKFLIFFAFVVLCVRWRVFTVSPPLLPTKQNSVSGWTIDLDTSGNVPVVVMPDIEGRIVRPDLLSGEN